MLEGRGTSRGAHDRKMSLLPHVVNALVVILVLLGVRSCVVWCVNKHWEWRKAEIHAEQMRDQERFKTCVESGLQPCERQVQR